MSSHARALGNFTHMLSLTLTEILLFCVHNMCLQCVMHECRGVQGCHNLFSIAIFSLLSVYVGAMHVYFEGYAVFSKKSVMDLHMV